MDGESVVILVSTLLLTAITVAIMRWEINRLRYVDGAEHTERETSMRVIMVTLEIDKGLTFDAACREALLYAVREWVIVRFRFNDQAYQIDPGAMIPTMVKVVTALVPSADLKSM